MSSDINISRASVASLHLQMRVRGQVLATGTGFVVQRQGVSFLVTNRHNLSGRHPETNTPVHRSAATPDSVVVHHNLKGHLGTWFPVTEPLLDREGRPLWLEHPTLGPRADVVALPLIVTGGAEFYPHDPWATEPDIRIAVANDVHIIGFPFGLTGGGAMGIWSRGSIATEPDVDFNDLPIFLIDSRTRPGQSGSPVIFHSSGSGLSMADGSTAFMSGPTEKFLGVYSGRVNQESDLGFVWKADVVAATVDAGRRPTA